MNKSLSEMLYACSKCFTRHPFEELSQGQQLCKKCRGDFPVVKCTYCRSEFQQESKSKTSSICKRCEQCVAQYGKPTSCQFCQLPAAFVGGKCQRCSSYNKRYGPPKTCEQCKQKSAFDKGDDARLMCWACSCSYKRALAKTKQSDPARHSRVFKKEKRPEEGDKHKKREKYMNSKKPNRPDVTKTDAEGATHNNPVKSLTKREREGDTDHVGEITQLKEKIVFLEKTIKQKDTQMIHKDKEITQMKAKLFNEENLIREKMKMMSKLHEGKVSDLTGKMRSLQNEIARLNKESRPTKGNKKMDNLFKDTNKRKVSSRTASPAPAPEARSRSRSPDDPAPVRSRSRSPATRPTSSSPSPAASVRSSPSRSPSPSAKARSGPSRSQSPAAKVQKMDSPAAEAEEAMETVTEAATEEEPPRNSRSPTPEPTEAQVALKSRSNSPAARNSRSNSPVAQPSGSNSPASSP